MFFLGDRCSKNIYFFKKDRELKVNDKNWYKRKRQIGELSN